MPPGCCPCAANSIISLQFWKTYTGCLLSKESNTRCCSSLIKLCMVKPRHISPSCCLCTLPPGPCDQRTKISSECQDAVWKGLVDAALRMPLHPFGTLSLHLLNVPLPLIPSRAAWRLIYLMWRIPRSTESYIVWVYCLWLFFLCFLLTSAFEHGDFSPFLILALYKCNIIIIIIIIIKSGFVGRYVNNLCTLEHHLTLRRLGVYSHKRSLAK